jgi:hypothetical protein
LTDVVISEWIKAALKDFDAFPERAQSSLLMALTITAEGGKADIAKPLRGLVRASSR